MKSLQGYTKAIKFILLIIIIGQVLFAFTAPSFTTPRYEGRIYATTGVQHKQEDLHKLNEAAHYFGQTIIGWLKFPHFFSQMSEAVDLKDATGLSAHIQERQNIIFTLSSGRPIELSTLEGVRDFMQSRIDEYNSVSLTKFILTNMDYELVEIKKSYAFGALVTLMASAVIGLAIVFIRREFD